MAREPDEWRRFEQAIAQYFADHGYDVETNVVLNGRSGAPHEIDVLATKSDRLTTIRVGVECKAWAGPIEKDVVTKLSVVLNDLGLNKGVVVSLHGWRTGAEQVAKDLGIDLWGPAEIELHLGAFAVAQVRAGSVPKSGLGWRFAAPAPAAEKLARAQGKGRLGLRTLEELVWFGQLWLPGFLLELSVTEPRGRGIVKLKLGTTLAANVYEGLSGKFVAPAASWGAPTEVQLSPAPVVTLIARDTSIPTEIRKTLERLSRVTQAAAIARHRGTLASLGVPRDATAVSVSASTLIHLPLHVGLLRQAAHERVVAVDGVTGVLVPRLSEVLTKHLPHVRASLAP